MSTELAAEYTEAGRRRFGEPGQSLAAIGENELVARLSEAARGTSHPGLLVPAGDDAAVFRPAPGRDLVLSQDAIVEGVDFRREWITPYQLGGRAVAVALSDLAASGARPEILLATLCAPVSTTVEDVMAMQAGMAAVAAAAGCVIAGGDVSSIEGPLVIDVTVVGSVAQDEHMSLSSGRAGDVLVVTGVLGRAAAGLQVLMGRGTGEADAVTVRAWLRAQLEPQARLAEGLELSRLGIRCATDLSDGLLTGARRMATASGCAAEVWRDSLPLDPDLTELADWFDLAVAGGEDFELLAAIPADEFDSLAASWPGSMAPLSVIGNLADGTGVRLRANSDGADLASPRPRAEHFTS